MIDEWPDERRASDYECGAGKLIACNVLACGIVRNHPLPHPNLPAPSSYLGQSGAPRSRTAGAQHQRARHQPHRLPLGRRRVPCDKQRLHRPHLGPAVALRRRRLELLRQPPEGPAPLARGQVRQQVLRVRVGVLAGGARLLEVGGEARQLRRRRGRGGQLQAAGQQAVVDLKVRRQGAAHSRHLVVVALGVEGGAMGECVDQ